MNEDIRKILAQITALEDQLHEAIKKQQVELNYVIEGTKVRFEKRVREAHRRLKIGYLAWLGQSELRNIITAPIIYSLIIPFVLLDLCVTVYQALCFPLYRIARVPRSSHITIDRHQLIYLNSIEKLNCVYCAYGNGVIAYVREVAARTEQYWCPIKHARKILDPHRRYAQFADYGDGENYRAFMQASRARMRAEHLQDTPAQDG